jgi:hypothetical protein
MTPVAETCKGKGKGKGKVTLEQTTKAQREIRGIALRFI